MIGTPHTYTQQKGRMIYKVAIAVLVFALSLSSCSIEWWVGEGRGDWEIDLCGGYCITKIHSRKILLTRKEGFEHAGEINERSVIEITNYYVTAYQMQAPYIFLEGIHTENSSITNAEHIHGVSVYYWIDSSSGEKFGPFAEYNDFAEHCRSMNLEEPTEWIETDKNIIFY